MEDIVKFGIAAILILIGSHLFLWAWLKRKIDSVKREIETEKAQGDEPGGN